MKKDIETAERRLRELSGEDEASDSKAEKPTQPAQITKTAAKKRGGTRKKK